MPYTPPSRGSPASSTHASPTLSRNQSYERSLSSPRPDAPPRSRSATYLHRHRRTPSLADNKPASHGDSTVTLVSTEPASATQGSTLPTLNPKLYTSFGIGLTMSPVESMSSEDDDERGRQRKIQDLADTLRESMVVTKKAHSPQRTEEGRTPAAPKSTPALVALTQLSPGLTPEAIKIAHSRSNSYIHLSTPSPLDALSAGESPGDSDDEGLLMKRGPMIRKKSGELVKPALRRGTSRPRPSSAPGTPTFAKAVHFNEDMEQVRHFLQVDRPIAVSAGSSPVEMYDSETDYPFGDDTKPKTKQIEWDIQLSNFPTDTAARQLNKVKVEELHLSKDSKNLIGTVAVANICFQKWVVARFTFDYWKTTSEVFAEFSHVPGKQKDDGYDRFQFQIKLADQANLQNKTLYLCVRYNTVGQEFWDNNAGQNFQVDFNKKLPTPQPVKQLRGAVGAIPRSRNSTTNVSLPRPRSFPSAGNLSDDEFSTTYNSPFPLRKFGDNANRGNQTQKPPTSNAQTAQHHSGPRLANRYDFSASLHAALSTAQTALGEKSGIKLPKSNANKLAHAPQPQPPRHKPTVVVPAAPAVQPPSLSRPELYSAEYNDLIQKFCYFGSGGNNSIVGSPEPKDRPLEGLPPLPQAGDATLDSGSETVSSAGSSTSNSPPSPRPVLPVDAPIPDGKASSAWGGASTTSPSLRAVSPRLLPYRSPSPAQSAYQEFSHQGPMVQTTQC